MDTRAIKLAFATELGSFTNMQPTVKFFWKTNRHPARSRQRVTAATMTTPSLPADQAHAASGSNFSAFTTKDGRISTRRKVDQEDMSKPSNWAVSLCDNLEKKVMSSALGNDTCDKEECYLLRDNYAPVEEMAPTADLPITGTIPVCANTCCCGWLCQFVFINSISS